MNNVDSIAQDILGALILDFRERELKAAALDDGYVGPPLVGLAERHSSNSVDFELALKHLEDKSLVETGPRAAHQNDPGSGIFILGMYSKREYVYLTEKGYKQAQSLPRAMTQARIARPKADHFYGIHPQIVEKCGELYEAHQFAEAVEKSFKVVRDRLRALTGYEKGSEAFGKGGLHIGGAAAPHVDADFNSAVKYLTMAIDMFRNEKSHTSDARIDDPIRAHEYLSLSSLAMYLLENAEVLKKN